MVFLAREHLGGDKWARYIEAESWREASLMAMARGWFLDGEFVGEISHEELNR